MISSTLIQSSLSNKSDVVIRSFEWEYPRFIHAEVLTHRMLAKSAGSSRAIPTVALTELAVNKMVVPEFRYNQAGMQPAGYLDAKDMDAARAIWTNCAMNCVEAANELAALKVHKQWANRMLEWFSPIKIGATATEWDNFLWLRNDSEAQDELEMLAALVEQQIRHDEPMILFGDADAHVPYVTRERGTVGLIYSVDGQHLTRDQALITSASLFGQMSYRKADNSLSKAEDLYGKFMGGRRIHASPFEHQAIVSDVGCTHATDDGRWYSGNLRGWSQYRHLIENNTCYDLETARMLEAVKPEEI